MVHILDRFEQTVNNHPDKVAVKHGDEEITFIELKKASVRLGCDLVRNCSMGLINRPIAVFLPKEIDAITSDLAILYSGNAFMNLDVKTPSERIGNIIEQIQPLAIITKNKYLKKLPNTETRLVLIEDVQAVSDDAIDGLLTMRCSIIDTDPFCIINTSGSTGTPKGVVLNQRSFFDFMVASQEQFRFDGSEVLGSLSPIVFDIFDFELCMMVFYGSQIVLLDAKLAAFPARLLQAMADANVTFIFWVPSIMVNIANMGLLEKIDLPDLRLVWFAGEVFPTKQFLIWYDRFPDTVFANLYGPIEITLDCTFYVVEKRPLESEPLPIGRPYRNTDVLILNNMDELCGVGEPGELCVRGTSLAMGYYNNSEKTGAAFTQNPLNSAYPETIYRTGDIVCRREDGNIMFKGRKDSLIKHMGYRIELGEIEHVVENDLKLVKYCCTVYNYEKKEIVMYYQNDDEISDKDFRKALANVFPSYMIPSVYMRMDELPRNINGKIDRLLLKETINKESLHE